MKIKSMLVLLLPMLMCFWVPSVMAQATRTWVSGVGDDANPCSRTAPCKTFAGAISKTATGGEIDVMDPGGFGGVTITKSITLDGGGGQAASVLVSGTDGIGINAAGATVILRNLRINGIGSGVNGINLMAAARLRVENVAIERFAASGINVSVGANATVMVQNTSIEGCATGISVQTSAGQAKATLNDVSISCTTGVAALAGANVTLHNSTVEGAITGVSIGTGGTATIDSSQIRYTTTGVQIDGSNSVLRLSNASILDNTTGIVATNSPKIYSYNNNRLTGNVTDGASPTTTYYQR